MQRVLCLMPSGTTKDQARARNCEDRSHGHIPREDVDGLVSSGSAEFVLRRRVLRLKWPLVLEWRPRCMSVTRPGREADGEGWTLSVDVVHIRGLSCRVGAELVKMLAQHSRRAIGLAMLADIRRRVEARLEKVDPQLST